MLPRKDAVYTLQDIDFAIDSPLLESETLEYKSDPARMETIVAKAVSAFANTAGGTLVLGVGEKDGRPVRTNPPGLEAMTGKITTDEYVDRLIRSKVVPNPSATVVPVPIGDTGRVYVVVTVAPRGAGPFRIVDTAEKGFNGRYYMRRGRESVEADHYYLRRLFAEAEDTAAHVRAYLQRRGFGEEFLPFMDRVPASLLAYHEATVQDFELRLKPTTTGLPRAVAVVMPSILRGDVIDTNAADVQEALLSAWPDLKGFGSGYESHYRIRPTVEGRMLRAGMSESSVLSYVEVHRTGYVEAARSDSGLLFEGKPYLDTISILRSLRAAVTVASKIQSRMNSVDRWHVGLYLARTAVPGLFTFLPPGSNGPIGHTVMPNLRIEELVTPEELSTLATLRRIDLRLANAFGLEEGNGFTKDRDLNRLIER